MDLRMFYQKLRKIEQEIADPHVVVVSHETPDGGRPARCPKFHGIWQQNW